MSATATISAIANDFDGFSGTIPKSSATVAEVLQDYGYNTGAWASGIIHPRTNHSEGPFDCWPTGYGLEYFYGFLAGEASQYEPTLYETQPRSQKRNPSTISLTTSRPTQSPGFKRHQAFAPDKPFLMYWAPGARSRSTPHLSGMGRQIQRQIR